MKKLIALFLTLILALACTACAETVYTKVTVDRELAAALLPGFGVPENQLELVDSILAVVNALGVKITSVEDGAQLDLDLNGQNALSLGWTSDDTGVTVVSTLFPNYMITMSNETIEAMMQQMAASMNSASAMDMAVMGEVFGGYLVRYIEACSKAGTPGDPVPGEYEFEGYTFDTMIPVTVDTDVLIDAFHTITEEMVNDEVVISMFEASAQRSGLTFDVESLRSAFQEMESYIPDVVTAEYYTNSDGSAQFYLVSEAGYEGKEGPSYGFTMLGKGENEGSMGIWAYDSDMVIGIDYAEDTVSVAFSMGEMYLGFVYTTDAGTTCCDIYFMNPQAPLIRLEVTTSEGGERTLPMDGTGKTALAFEDVMNDSTGQLSYGLVMDFQNNGMGALMGVAMNAVPEIGTLIGMLSGGQSMAG